MEGMEWKELKEGIKGRNVRKECKEGRNVRKEGRKEGKREEGNECKEG